MKEEAEMQKMNTMGGTKKEEIHGDGMKEKEKREKQNA